MKRVIAFTLVFVMTFTMLSGCAKTNPSTTTTAAATAGTTAKPVSAEPHGIFNTYFLADLDTINPHTYILSDSGSIFGLTSMNLYRFIPNEKGDGYVFTTDLAESEPKQTDSEGKVWTIKILENAKWQNGDKINIDDLIYSWKMCLDPLLVNSRSSQMASDYITIVNAKEYSLQGKENKVKWEDVGIKKLDDYTVEITCTEPVTVMDIKNHLNYTWNGLVHKGTYEANMSADKTSTTYGSNSEKFMSCGPYILKE